MLKDLKLKNAGIVETRCVCPECGVMYLRVLETEHAKSEYTWRLNDRLVIHCSKCRQKLEDIEFGINKKGV